MIQPIPANSLFFVCDHQGEIQNVLKDDISLLSNAGLPHSFFSIFDLNSTQKSREFWDGLQRESAIFDWELNINTTPLPEVYKFSGFVLGDQILIAASKYNEVLEAMFDEMMSMNNEQLNLLRHTQKSLSVLKKEEKFGDDDILNEMTQLNNDLVNSQRTLVKQNAEITRLNSQLQLANADLEQFTYVASHDLKEPLRMVTGFMELLKNKYVAQLDLKAATYIDYALDGGKRMEKMIVDLLELTRTGRKDAAREIIDMNVMLKEVKQNIYKLIEETGAELTVAADLPVLAVYRADMACLLQNLLSNAIKFRFKDTTPLIRLSIVEQESQWLFSIEDNGIGIEKDKFEKIFEIFARLHSKESYDGTGIGLAVCKKVVQHHGGSIWVESEKGKGSTFFFTIKK